MNYLIDKSKLVSDDVRWFSNLEHDFLAEAQKLLNARKSLNLIITPTLSVVERKKGEPFLKFVSDASFNIPGSLDLNLCLKEWFEKRIDYEPSNVSFSVNLSFRVKEDDGKQGKAADDGLSTFIPETPRHTFDQIIIPDETRKQIMDSLSVVVHRDLVYNTWGFGKCDKSPNSILSFYGPPGTGKTM